MRFRLRTRAGQSVLSDASLNRDASTVFDLRLAVYLHLSALSPSPTSAAQADPFAQAARLSVKFGYPPKSLDAAHDAWTLAAACVADGEQLTVEMPSDIGPPAPAPAPAPVAAAPKPSTPAASDFNPSSDVVLGEFVHVPDHDGYLILRQSPDDNSCLFHSIAYVVTRGAMTPHELRMLAVRTIKENVDTYTEAVLGRPVDEYCAWLSKSQAWGGAIELAIFAKHFQTEICSVDVLTMRIDRFGEGQYDKRAFVVYNSIHYDALGLAPSLESPREFDATVFPVASTKLLESAVQLAGQLHKAHRYTDTANFTLSCAECGVGLRGQAAALEHALVSGHSNFTEYKG
ncbi:ubiquitin-specific protease otu1 [Blastocladiella emersonii ATCC 22665]|nr:ubiquitin-specific protease otu1 [Blastocladiella emersonii ATCC 22665]